MGSNFGWIELVLFYGVVLGFCVWQLISLKKANRAAAEQEKLKKPPETIA